MCARHSLLQYKVIHHILILKARLQKKLYCPPDCLRVRRYGRFPSKSSGKPFLDFSGVYISSSGGSKGAKTVKRPPFSEYKEGRLQSSHTASVSKFKKSTPKQSKNSNTGKIRDLDGNTDQGENNSFSYSLNVSNVCF